NLIQRQEQRKGQAEDYSLLPVSSIMQKNVPTVKPDTSTLEAIALMRKNGVSCLPVVSEEALVGILTEHDFMNLTAQFLESGLGK
ncbi:MAG: CBS domain-containing protein, partial [bacterium]